VPLPSNPLVNPDDFNRVIIASSIISPGLASLSGGAERPYNWDIRYAPGLQGAVIMYWGWKLSESIKFTFKFWEAQQIADFYSTFLPALKYDVNKKRPTPVSIYHPVLAANDVVNVVTKSIGPLVDAGQQLWTCTVEFLEYRLPKRQNLAVTPDKVDTKKPTALDAQDREIAKLLVMAAQP
jgi:hypothetical protein